MEKNKEVIIHFHIGKTGGISLRNILKNKFKKEFISLTINQIHSNKNNFIFIKDFLREKEKYKFSCISGHIPFGIHQYLNSICKYITILIDPVKRVISDYNYVINETEHPLNKYYLSNNKLTFEEYINFDITKHSNILPKGVYVGSAVHNLQSRLISGEMFSDIFENNMQEYNYKDALDNIENKFFLVGTLDKFDQFLFVLKKLFKWNFLDIRHIKNNISKQIVRYNNLDKKIINEIEILNSHDMALYERAKIKFEREYGNIKKNKNFLFFQNFNKLYNKLKLK